MIFLLHRHVYYIKKIRKLVRPTPFKRDNIDPSQFSERQNK